MRFKPRLAGVDTSQRLRLGSSLDETFEDNTRAIRGKPGRPQNKLANRRRNDESLPAVEHRRREGLARAFDADLETIHKLQHQYAAGSMLKYADCEV